jgi:hypothetical protein
MSNTAESLIEPEVSRMQDGTETICRCRICQAPFLPLSSTMETCGKKECHVALVRQKSHEWAAQHRNVHKSNPWLLGPPVYGPYLPGGGCILRASPRPRWPLEHRNVRLLHGMVTTISGVTHVPMDPAFALIPWTCRFGWAVFFWEDALARRMAGHTFDARIAEQQTAVTFSPLWRLKAPTIAKRGRRKLRIDALTPVCCRSMGGTVQHTIPTAGAILSSLTLRLPTRLGLERYGFSAANVRLELIERKHQIGSVFIGDKYGLVRGWAGHVIVETNAIGHWLLKACETVGLGSRTAFGFGRIRVSEVDK